MHHGPNFDSEREFWIKNSHRLQHPKISERNRRIVTERYGLDSDELPTLRELGARYQITPERVRQITSATFNRVMRMVEEDHKRSVLLADIPISELELSARAYNSLTRLQIRSLADLINKTPQQLLEIDMLGMTSLADIIDRLREHPLGPFYLRGNAPRNNADPDPRSQ
jgi:hypothetical protein